MNTSGYVRILLVRDATYWLLRTPLNFFFERDRCNVWTLTIFCLNLPCARVSRSHRLLNSDQSGKVQRRERDDSGKTNRRGDYLFRLSGLFRWNAKLIYIERYTTHDNGYADNSLHECIPDMYCNMYDLVASYYFNVISAFDYCKLGKFN